MYWYLDSLISCVVISKCTFFSYNRWNLIITILSAVFVLSLAVKMDYIYIFYSQRLLKAFYNTSQPSYTVHTFLQWVHRMARCNQIIKRDNAPGSWVSWWRTPRYADCMGRESNHWLIGVWLLYLLSHRAGTHLESYSSCKSQFFVWMKLCWHFQNSGSWLILN